MPVGWAKLGRRMLYVRMTKFPIFNVGSRLPLKCDGTRAETRFRLSAERMSPFKSAGTSGQSTTGSRGVRISRANAGYTMFPGGVKGTGYPFHSPVFPSPPPVRHRVPSPFNCTLTNRKGHGVDQCKGEAKKPWIYNSTPPSAIFSCTRTAAMLSHIYNNSFCDIH